MSDVEQLKARACAVVDRIHDELLQLSLDIHANVEVAFEEVLASGWISSLLERHGLAVERGLGSLPTAFRGRAGSAAPCIAYLCEYDGLPPYGQSCGHNVGAAASAGAGIALASVLDEVDGSVVVLGTPGEEGSGGKKIMMAEGAFAGIDAMMLIYPGMNNVADSRTLASASVRFEYFGKAAHTAARPELGINALDAMVLAFNGVNALRQQLPSEARVHGIITKGGTLPMVIPDHTTGQLTLRANDARMVEALKPRVEASLEGAAIMTGARLERIWQAGAQPLLRNRALAAVFAANLTALGRDVRPREELSGAWSADTGAASWSVPTIEPQVAMTGFDVPPHSHEFHAASASPEAAECIRDAAKAMAMSGIDLLCQDGLLPSVTEEFQARRSRQGPAPR